MQISRQTEDWRYLGVYIMPASLEAIPNSRIPSSADKTIKVWDLAARAAVSTIQDTGEVWSVSWRPRLSANKSASGFISGGEDGLVKWWRAAGTG